MKSEKQSDVSVDSGRLFYFGNLYSESLSFGFIRLFQICEVALVPGGMVYEHTQICNEITYIVSGTGKISTNDTVHTVRPGDVHLISSGDRHRIETESAEKLRYICIGYSLEHVPPKYDFLQKFCSLSPAFVRESGNELRCLIEMLIGEFYTYHAEREKVVEELLNLILLMTYRLFRNGISDRNQIDRGLAPPDTVYRIVKYVDENIDSMRNVREISQNLHYTESYVSTVFRRRMGITLQHYIRDKKLESAKMLLEYGNRTVSEVSEILHFDCMQSFSRSFKAKFGVTPSQFIAERNTDNSARKGVHHDT